MHSLNACQVCDDASTTILNKNTSRYAFIVLFLIHAGIDIYSHNNLNIIIIPAYLFND